MFDIGWGEFLVIGIVALIVIGPKELPGVLRSLGQAITKIRRMASDFQDQFREAMREAEMADIKKSMDDLNAAARGITTYDPLNPDGLGPVMTETKPDEAVKTSPPAPAASEPAAQPALPEPDIGLAEAPKPGEGRAS